MGEQINFIDSVFKNVIFNSFIKGHSVNFDATKLSDEELGIPPDSEGPLKRVKI